MATTVYGCIAVNGTITFADLEICLSQVSCEVANGGEHAGQVALTLSNAHDATCTDTFYGCKNPTTGKYEVVIPDGCCCDCPTGYEDVNENHPCTEGGVVPSYICARFYGIRRCSNDSLIPDILICLPYDETYSDPDNSLYFYTGSASFEGTTALFWVYDNNLSDTGGAGICDSSDGWFYMDGWDPCGCHNGFAKEACGTSPYVGTPILGNRVIKGYGGDMRVYDPNTGEWWAY